MIAELEKVYRVLNKGLFGGKLSPPSFRVDTNTKPAFRYRGEQSQDIVIGSEFAGISLREVPDGLLHVMIHIRNYALGVEDCTTNQYHKRAFSEMALGMGLTVMKTSSRGWGITTSRKSEWQKFDEDLVRHPIPVDAQKRHGVYQKVHIDSGKLSQFKTELRNKLSSVEKKQFQLKYICQCPPPHNSIRSGRRPSGRNRLNAKCNECGSRYKVVDKD